MRTISRLVLLARGQHRVVALPIGPYPVAVDPQRQGAIGVDAKGDMPGLPMHRNRDAEVPYDAVP